MNPTVICYTAAIRACGEAGQGEEALSLLREMPSAGVTPNLFSYSATISACAKSGQWEQGLVRGSDRERGRYGG